MRVRVDRDRVYLGESFLLYVEVQGVADGLGAPDLAALRGASARALDPETMSTATLLNGRWTRSVNVTFPFAVQPSAAGEFRAGPVRLAYRGQTYEAQGPTVTVVGVEAESNVVARVTASSAAVLVDEPFTVTLSVAVAALPAPNERFEPLLPANMPHLQVDFLSRQEIRGLKVPEMRPLLEGLLARDGRTPGFALNDFVTREPDFMTDPLNFNFRNPFEPRPLRFRLPAHRDTIDGRPYWVYTVAASYTPQQEGDYTFGPLTFKGPIIAGTDAAGRALTRDVLAVGPAVTVRVVPPPAAGRPDWFVGSVGCGLQARAELDAAVCKVGDPLTLTLDVTGEISLSNLRPPILNLQPDLTRDFRIYDEDVVTASLPQGKRFRYRVRPLRAGTLEFPAVRVAYFDTAQRRYVTVATAPIPVQARATTQIASVAAEGEGDAPFSSQSLTASGGPQPAAVTVSSQGSRPAPLLPTSRNLLASVALPPCLWLAGSGAVWAWTRRARWTVALRRGRARARAAGSLGRLKGNAAGPPDAVARAAADACRAYLAARLAVPGGALTAVEVRRLLLERGVNPSLAGDLARVFEVFEAAVFQPQAAASGAVSEAVARARELLPEVERALRRPALSREEA